MTSTDGSGPSRRLGPPHRSQRDARIFVSSPVSIGFAGPEHRFVRADLEIDGIPHDGASYEGRVFLNNPTADKSTPKAIEQGYAGSFYIFGHGGCLGDPGHCEVKTKTDPFDFRPPHPLTPAMKRVIVTEALRRAATLGSTATITIVPIVTAANDLTDDVNVFRCTSMLFRTYN